MPQNTNSIFWLLYNKNNNALPNNEQTIFLQYWFHKFILAL